MRSLNGVLFRDNSAKGMVITTARDFTSAAKAEAAVKTQTAEMYEMILLAFDDVVSMLRIPTAIPYQPWIMAFVGTGVGTLEAIDLDLFRDS